jgi:hypothetical protein
MDAAEFFGRTLTVNRAKPNAIRQMNTAITEQQQHQHQSQSAMQVEQ